MFPRDWSDDEELKTRPINGMLVAGTEERRY